MIGKNPSVLGKNPSVVMQDSFDSRKTLRVQPLQVNDLCLKRCLVLNEKGLRLDQRRHRFVKLVHLPVALTATLGHATAPMREPSFYLDVPGFRDETPFIAREPR